ncbi:Trans-1,2-dihydrobenzene-1,2-diol dehydrogenase [Portunus trituberculatus]|uniref:Trans-1,2-dihydrobenzene-1,2-diol dehydrogenase n=1 Tax=Portunus trituberculatus TaxID=210409 RepID=A0A5B7CSB0_PORTR|nr:Trans-1,2-dihydrobenzene-1,2-diol dehydrogenase [Portunus trituberculatus]
MLGTVLFDRTACNMATRWGIISAGIISTDFVSAMQVLPKEEHQVVAVAARSLQDARNFATKFGIESAYGSYSEVAKDPKPLFGHGVKFKCGQATDGLQWRDLADNHADVVYIGTIQTYHLPVATEMMKAGKAVLCEKPLCMNVRETRQLIQTAQECGVFFMEAVWSRFFPAYKELSRRLKDGEIGEVVQVIASFGQDLPHVERLKKCDEGNVAPPPFHCARWEASVELYNTASRLKGIVPRIPRTKPVNQSQSA